MVKVYLCGGLVSNWQTEVVETVSRICDDVELEFYRPDLYKRTDYSAMDKLKIEQCDILFAYLEKTNPTPVNIALEIGYAKGLGKIVILCNEWTIENYANNDLKTMATDSEGSKATWFKPRYLDMLIDWCDFVDEDFGRAIQLLGMIVKYEV